VRFVDEERVGFRSRSCPQELVFDSDDLVGLETLTAAVRVLADRRKMRFELQAHSMTRGEVAKLVPLADAGAAYGSRMVTSVDELAQVLVERLGKPRR
jgi:hypothetical protein